MSLETDFHVLTSHAAYCAMVAARRARQDFKDSLDSLHVEDWNKLHMLEQELEQKYRAGSISDEEYEAACETYSDWPVYTHEELELLDLFTATLAKAESAAGYGLPVFSCQSSVGIEDTVLHTEDEVRAFLTDKRCDALTCAFLSDRLPDLQAGKVVLVEQELH